MNHPSIRHERPLQCVRSARLSGVGRHLGFHWTLATAHSLRVEFDTTRYPGVACIQWAYSVSSYQVSGPSWIDSERYDISARAAGPAPEAQLRLMLRPLLSERFRLKFHRDTKTLQGYALLVAPNGPKLRESTSGGEPEMKMNRSIVVAQAMPMEQFVRLVMRSARGPVVDLTGLTERYDFTFDLAKYVTPDTPPDDMFAALCQALQQEFGLRVEARKLPLEVLVLDRAEKAPLEN